MKHLKSFLSLILMAAGLTLSCTKAEDLEKRLDSLEDKVAQLETAVGQINANTIAISKFTKENILIVRYTKNEHSYELELSDGTAITVTDGINAPCIVPIVSVDMIQVPSLSTDTIGTIQGALIPSVTVMAVPSLSSSS